MSFNATFITLFPELFPGTLGASLAGRALAEKKWDCHTINLRDHGVGKHNDVDDTPYGGGAGMVLKPDVAASAINAAQSAQPNNLLINLSPRGELLTQSVAKELAQAAGITFLCSRFEGVDQRVLDHYQPCEISIGDYILFGGEVAAMAVMEAVLRNIPSVLGNHDTVDEESFDFGENSALLLEYHQYTKPPFWGDYNVPDVLKSGHHGDIAKWRKAQAETITKERRKDIWQHYIGASEKE